MQARVFTMQVEHDLHDRAQGLVHALVYVALVYVAFATIARLDREQNIRLCAHVGDARCVKFAQQLVLVVEVLIEGARGGACAHCDGARGGARVAALRELLGGRLEQSRTRACGACLRGRASFQWRGHERVQAVVVESGYVKVREQPFPRNS
jgi:hypothetical protein